MSKIIQPNKPTRPHCDICICMVTRKRGQMEALTRQCLDATYAFLASKKVVASFSDVASSNLARNRSGSIRNVQAIGADYMIFVDDDMVFDPDAIYNMWRQKENILSAVATKKAFPFTPGATMVNPETGVHDIVPDILPQGLIEVDACGTGFLMVKMSVYDKVPAPWFGFVPNGLFEDYKKLFEASRLALGQLGVLEPPPKLVHESCARLAEVVSNITPPEKDRTGTTGEDYYFCHRARELGFKVKVDCGIRVGHLGQYAYGYDDYLTVKKAEEERS